MALPAELSQAVHRQAGDAVSRLLVRLRHGVHCSAHVVLASVSEMRCMLCFCCGQAGDASRCNGASLKSLTLAPGVRAKSATYALCRETLKYLSVIQSVVQNTQLLTPPASQRRGRGKQGGGEEAPPGLVYVLVYDLLFGRGFTPMGDTELAVCAAEPALRGALQKHMALAGVATPRELLPAHITAAEAAAARQPRCVRVNTLRLTVSEAVAQLRGSLPAGVAITPDALLPDVLLLPAGTDLHAHHLVTTGALVLQTRGSCMAAHALAPRPGWVVVDACAAPGNKTTHLAAVMRGSGRVHAFDANPERLERLRAAVRLAGAHRVVGSTVADFLRLDPCAEPLRSADALLLDPSCSGSGTALTRGDALLPSAGAGAGGTDEGRIAALSRFQLAALRHALKCPKASRLVYSTCSVHAQENECVVAAALASPGVAAAGWRLEAALPGWRGRGHPGHGLDDASTACLVRTDPLTDDCDGFFLALFVRDVEPDAREAPKPREVRWAGGGGGGKRKRGGSAAPLFV